MRRAIRMGAVLGVVVLAAGCGTTTRPPRLVAPRADPVQVRDALKLCMVSRALMAETRGTTTIAVYRTRSDRVETCVEDGDADDGAYDAEAILGITVPRLTTLKPIGATPSRARIRIGVLLLPAADHFRVVEGTLGPAVTGLGFTRAGRVIASAEIRDGRFLAVLPPRNRVTGAIIVTDRTAHRQSLPRQVAEEISPRGGFFDDFIEVPGTVTEP